ncbi:MAG: toxin TcdB middle/N-terminal domain-containing protein, partial [Desulfobacteraceae bacterium]
MLIITDIDRRPIFKYITWLTLYIFFINFLSYPVFAYNKPTSIKTSQVCSVGAIINSIMDMFATAAHAEEEEPPPIYSNLGSESPNIEEFTGSYSQIYPIEVPPGRGGLAPQIALTYSSIGQNGWVGVGWDIAISSIERDTKEGEPGYDDNDSFIININGVSSKLVKDGLEYRLKDESTFLKVEKFGDYWEVKDKNGTTYRFGNISDSKLNGGLGTFRWYLNSVEDLNGNVVNYSYYSDNTNHQIYLSQIDYAVGNSIEFVLDPLGREDTIQNYNTHFRVETVERLKEIHIKNGSSIVKAYSLDYDYSGTSLRSILKSIKVYGNDAIIGGNGTITSGSSLPETTFDIPAANNSFEAPVNWHNYVAVKDIYAGGYIKSGDFNGDGRTDLLYLSSEPEKYMVMLSNGTGFEDPVDWHDYNENLDNFHSLFWVNDYNGNGKDDIMYYDSDTERFMVMLSNGYSFEDPVCWIEHDVTMSSWSSWINDFNGDGKADVMYRSSIPSPQYYVMLSTGTGFENPVSWHSWEGGYNLDKTFRLGDYNGDGLIDITYVSSRVIVTNTVPDKYVVMLNNGSGFEDPVDWHDYIHNKSDYTLDYLQACDFNGDGLVDLLYTSLSPEKYMVMLSNGSGFEDPVAWHDYVTTSDLNRQLMFSDFNGDGKTDIMYLSPSPEKYMVMLSNGLSFENPVAWNDYDPAHLNTLFPFPPTIYIPLLFLDDFTGDGKADILYLASDHTQYKVMANNSTFDHIIKNTNSLGAVTEVEYVSSSEWENDYLPFKLQTVKSITTKDKDQSPTHTSTKIFTYQGGKYDTVEREFRGFERITVTDDVTGFVTETHYLTDEIYKGKVSWTETKDSLGYKVVRTDNTWNIKDYGDDRRFIYLDDSVVTKYDENGASLATITKDYGYSDDSDFSNLVTEYMHTSDGINKFIRTNYYNDEANWIIGKPENIRISTSDPGSTGTQALRETKFTYYTNGLLHEKKLVHWENGAPIEYTTTYGYDIYGNKTSEADAKGTPPTTLNYNESMGMFPNLVTNALGHIIHRTFDPSFGTILTETDPNNQTVNYTYDEFGRKESATYPDGSTETFTYNCDLPKNYHNFCRINDHKIFNDFGHFAKFFRSFGEELIRLRRS